MIVSSVCGWCGVMKIFTSYAELFSKKEKRLRPLMGKKSYLQEFLVVK